MDSSSEPNTMTRRQARFQGWNLAASTPTLPILKWMDPSSGSNPSMVASSVPILGTSQLRYRSNVSNVVYRDPLVWHHGWPSHTLAWSRWTRCSVWPEPAPPHSLGSTSMWFTETPWYDTRADLSHTSMVALDMTRPARSCPLLTRR